jgi:hypothetical protein
LHRRVKISSLGVCQLICVRHRGVVDSAPRQASGCAEAFDVLGVDEEGQPPFLNLTGERLDFQRQCGVVAAHHRDVKIADGVACHQLHSLLLKHLHTAFLGSYALSTHSHRIRCGHRDYSAAFSLLQSGRATGGVAYPNSRPEETPFARCQYLRTAALCRWSRRWRQ